MSSMTDNETYNGYANRETWAFNVSARRQPRRLARAIERDRMHAND